MKLLWLQNRLAVWLLLIAATLISVEVIGLVIPGRHVIVAIMALAAIKATLVAWTYMDMAAAPTGWSIAFIALFWLGAAMIAGLNLAA